MDHALEPPSRARAGAGSSWRRWVGQRCARRRIASRQFCFAVIFTSVLLAKAAHLHANKKSISTPDFLTWGATFFFQDVIALLLARALLADHWSHSLPRVVAAAVTGLFSIILLFMASVSVSFYVEAGAEVHWRQLKTFLKDTSAAKTLQSGATGTFLASVFLLILSWIITPYAHALVGRVFVPIPWFIKRWCCVRPARHREYHRVDQGESDAYADSEEAKFLDEELDDPMGSEPSAEKPTKRSWIVLIPFVILIALQVMRPARQSFVLLSQTLALSPFSNMGHGSGVDMASLMGTPSFDEQCDSIGETPKFDWLPPDVFMGFEDWYADENGTMPQHYSPERDCAHISNLGNPFLDPVRDALRDNDVKIKHIILIKLETTRKDHFPMVKDSYPWQRVAETHPNHHLPDNVVEGLRNLTPTIEWLTGDSTLGDGIRDANSSRGGISASNAYTASTYTLKSIIASLCGEMPLSTDFNQEYYSHFYNPCMTHVLRALNHVIDHNKRTDDFTSWPWETIWMQSVTDTFDNQDKLTPVLGFNRSFTKETLKSSGAEFYPPATEDINYFGLEDAELKPYLRAAFQKAEKAKERLFITHLTGTTHHPWGLPVDFPSIDFIGKSTYFDMSNFNKYLNTIKYIDGWMADILEVLNETGVANETLIVMAGDHGASLPEDGNITPFDNPHVGVFHVPLAFSHPSLPQIKVDAPVTTLDILPTMLDLLISSDSLEEKSKKAAADLLPLYEGQSILRPQENYTADGHRHWHFTILNSGGSWVGMRSTTETYRVLVPLAAEVSWRFTDVAIDPQEASPIFSFDWPEFKAEVEKAHGEDAVNWLNEAAPAADWWLARNRELWQWEEK